MSILSDLGTKIGMELKSLWTAVNDKVSKSGDTISGNLSVTGDLKMSGTDSYIWTPGTGTGYTGIWDSANSYKVLQANESNQTLLMNDTKGSIQIGTNTKAMDNVVKMQVSNGYKNSLEMTSEGQGSANIYLGQSSLHGSGILYNADDTPNELETEDYTVFYRRSNGTDYTMMKWWHGDAHVTFQTTPKVGTTNVMLGNKTISTSTPSGGSNGDIWIQV